MRKHGAEQWPQGQIFSLQIESASLADNLLGDASSRRVDVYIPAGHTGKDLPLLIDLAGFTSSALAHTGWRNYGENIPERLDRLIGSGTMLPVVMAFPDSFTRLGGNQFVNSLAMGNWEDFMIKDMLPAIESRFECGGAGKRGLFGRSSGGYGSIIHGMRHGGEVWSAIACHSGDMDFPLMYRSEFCNTLRSLAKYDFSIEAFIYAFEEGPKASGSDWGTMMMLAQCASFDPDPDAFCGVRLPVTTDTCELIPEYWANWLKWDPLQMIEKPEYRDGLSRLKFLFVDCGTVDQYNLLYGARIMRRKLEEKGVAHIYEEFSDNHSSLDYRYDRSWPLMARALSRA
ncbi:alpha/beta hydrolase-fold protein [Microvirga sp. W0021]|uniref:Alpha/beta hydrolase-fold protein n=1 Tax=Hohaiivirga grylli TaxID=3133970 RepID=A0ABV0BHA0_9HYPH